MSRQVHGPWVCPMCDRQFARRGQGHECAPAMTLEEFFATSPPFERPIVETVLDHVGRLGAPFVEPVSVGVFVKCRGHTVLQLRTMTKWVALYLFLPRTVIHPSVARKPMISGRSVVHVVNLGSVADIDDTVRDWIDEAWLTAAAA